MAAVNELVQKVKERSGQKRGKMAPESQVHLTGVIIENIGVAILFQYHNGGKVWIENKFTYWLELYIVENRVKTGWLDESCLRIAVE